MPHPAARRSLAFLLLFAMAASAAFGQPTKKSYMVEMPDGIKLATDVYWPADGNAPYATVLVRTPYGKGMGLIVANQLCPRGYAVVVQDMRGRFESEGDDAIIFGNDGIGAHSDGQDTMKWITDQRWSNGKIVTWGGSAVGISQNQAAPGAPSSLKGMAVQVAFSNYYQQGAYQGGVLREALMGGWLKGTDMLEGNWDTFKAHPYYDDFWKSLDAERHAEQVDAPGIYTGGWYDIFLQGTINSFTSIQNRGGPNARGNNFLVVAPIAHGPVDLIYPDAMKMPVNGTVPIDLYDYWVHGKDVGVSGLKPVHYYVMGAASEPGAPGNYWRSADTWPPASLNTPAYFNADGSLSLTQPQSQGSRRYQYDPTNPVPTVGGANLIIPMGPKDQREVETRGDVLVFTSAPVEEPVEVTGRITAKLYIESDCPDTDFTVKLCDVYPDGRSMLVTDGIRRASLRNGFEIPEFLEVGRVYEIEVDLWSTSLIFNKGHKIRVSVSSSNAPRFEPNPNTGEPHMGGETRVANNTIRLSKDYPSHIVLPIYKASE